MYRNRPSFTFALIIVIVSLMTAFFGEAVLAQTSTPTARASEVEIVGRVTDFSGLSITILGQMIDISKAEFYGSFSVGDVVNVKATLNSDGTLSAIEVEPARAGVTDNNNDNAADNSNDNLGNDNAADNSNDNADDSGNDNRVDFKQEFELSGTVTEIGADYVVVSGFRLQTAGARIEGAVTVGATVKAEVRLVNNAYVATRIELRSSSDDRVLSAGCVVKAPEGWTTYAVRFGDTLSGIAVGSGARLSDIVTTNCIANPNRVVVGTVLFVPRAPLPLAGNNNNANDNSDDHGNNNSNDNHDDHGNDNSDDHGGGRGNDNHDNGGDDHGGGRGNDNSDD